LGDAERTLSERELNRALLARQSLLGRRALGVPKALDRMGTLQAQYAPSMYIGLWSRVEGLERAAVTRALERRSAVQATLMRTTIHLCSAADYWPLTAAIRDERREQWLRTIGKREGITRAAIMATAETVRERLAEGPLSRVELDDVTGKGGYWSSGMNVWLDLVRVPPAGTWERRRADVFGLAEEWVGPDPALGGGDAVEHLVRRYLTGYGPASRKEVANWAGLKPTQVDSALERMTLRRFRAEDGEELLDLPRQALPDPATPAPVRFIPTWDAILLAHARRAGVLPERDRDRIFTTKMPQSIGTFLVDGSAAGTWRFEEGRITAKPWCRLDSHDKRELDAEAERLQSFHL
jgi:hypothetical protein